MKKRILGILMTVTLAAGMAGCGASGRGAGSAAESTTAAGVESGMESTAVKGSGTGAEDGSGGETFRIKENAQVSYLGPAGTYTEEAARFFFGESAVLSPQSTVDLALSELVSGRADYAVIPQENTLGGAVTNYLDALLGQTDIYVVGEVILPISQTLMGVAGTELDGIKTVCSHTQGLKQTKEWRSKNLPDAAEKEMDSTAAAASYVAESGDKSIAAIAAPGAADLYGLEVLAENVQISRANKTRFYVLSGEKAAGTHTHAVYAATCKADRIDDIIVKIHETGLEMVTLHDRPEGSALGSYRYIIELEDEKGITEEQIKEISELEELKFYGTFDVKEKSS